MPETGNTPSGDQAPCRHPPTPETGWAFGKRRESHRCAMALAVVVAGEATLALLKEESWLRKGDYDLAKHKADQSGLKKKGLTF